jgi:rubrerythrin
MKSKVGQATGTSDPIYNLVSVTYHALQGAENYEQYAQDAQQEGDQELADFFRQVLEQSRQCAEQAKQLLASRLQGGETGMGAGRGAGMTGDTATMGHAGSKPGSGG